MTPTLASVRRSWSDLRPLAAEDALGDLEASFVAPLRHLAPRGLALIGLRRWYGKRFRDEGGTLTGINLVRRGEQLVETLPMQVRPAASLVDGLPVLAVTYPASSRRPWPWVRDELRVAEDGTIVGMTFVDVPVLRRLGGTPFLLTRPASH
ncbi:hypothetical protein [Nocardioides daeguensis]|uniref:PAS domain-containing protein n=1 Tax=Nocardioides daeguensis TaxID=908359 RepID=A0ABP6W0J9_9ACTN|nr:hypothetical protein [Nocardioides daeguensis]MBV6726643.1 hypothetical protein [Nocardioides daeguensis]MCR1774605.1 hypothetical protein [Nocardioides daeguensis]